MMILDDLAPPPGVKLYFTFIDFFTWYLQKYLEKKNKTLEEWMCGRKGLITEFEIEHWVRKYIRFFAMQDMTIDDILMEVPIDQSQNCGTVHPVEYMLRKEI